MRAVCQLYVIIVSCYKSTNIQEGLYCDDLMQLLCIDLSVFCDCLVPTDMNTIKLTKMMKKARITVTHAINLSNRCEISRQNYTLCGTQQYFM